MHTNQFNPSLDVSTLEDCEVIGVDGDLVVHYNAEEGGTYNAGVTVQQWLDGHSEAWLMTEAEAARIGVTDYAAYVTRVADRNPGLAGRKVDAEQFAATRLLEEVDAVLDHRANESMQAAADSFRAELQNGSISFAVGRVMIDEINVYIDANDDTDLAAARDNFETLCPAPPAARP